MVHDMLFPNCMNSDFVQLIEKPEKSPKVWITFINRGMEDWDSKIKDLLSHKYYFIW